MSRENAKRAGVLDLVDFTEADIDRLAPPAGSPGLVITNPPYGARVGDRRDLARLYRMLGDRLRGQFSGWRVGIVTADPELAKASALPFLPALAPVSHGGLRVSLYRTAALP
jgi:putative N6-adenine-specific DNA methylase